MLFFRKKQEVLTAHGSKLPASRTLQPTSFPRLSTLPLLALFLLALFAFFYFATFPTKTNLPSLTKPPHNTIHSSQKLIFSINSGRVGTGYLAALLDTSTNITSLHEPEPVMVGEYLHLTDDQPMAASFKIRSIKADAIAQELARLPPHGTYAESNPNFIKTFYDVVLDRFKGQLIRVLVLHRPLTDVLKSLIELGHFRSDQGNPAASNWIPSHLSVNRAHEPCIEFQVPSLSEEDQYYHLIWYLIEIEARGARFKKEFAHQENLDIIDVTLDEMIEISKVEQLFERLQLDVTEDTRDFVGKKVNERKHVKNRFGAGVDVETCKERFNSYLNACKKKKIAIPPLMVIAS